MPSKCEPKTRFIPATCAWSLLLGATSMFFVFPCTYLAIHYHIAIPICQGIVTFFVLANFTLATFMDPGIIPKASPDETRDDDFRVPLYKNVEINGITVRMKWCATCRFYRPPRCSHCSVCNNCIETFDHHCPWVNNCIGRRNYRHFFLFLVSLSIHMISIFGFCVIYLLDHMNQLESPETIVCIAIMVIIFCLIFPILGLTGFHVVLVSRGRTTNEQVTGKFRGGYNPFSRGCCENVMYSLCGPQHPRYITRKPPKKASDSKSRGGSPISTIPMENQVRIYMDTSNGVRSTNPNAYCKMSQGPNVSDADITLDTIDTTQSQSQDCEPTPPCPRNGSKTNLLDTAEFREALASSISRAAANHVPAGVKPGAARCASQGNNRSSPHPRPRMLSEQLRSRSGTPDSLSPDGLSSRSIGSPSATTRVTVRTPPVRRSNPGTPTTIQSPGFSKRAIVYGSPVGDGRPPLGYPCYPDVRESAMYRQRQLQYQATSPPALTTGGNVEIPPRSISPQRKFASESELLRAAGDGSNVAAVARNSNHTADNLRELASSGNWRDPYCQQQQQHSGNVQVSYYPHYRGQSPAAATTRSDFWSHPTSPTSTAMVTTRPTMFSPPPSSAAAVYHGGGNVSPQPKRKVFGQTVVTSSYDGSRVPLRRPVSFVRALEVTDAMEMTTPSNRGGGGGGGGFHSPSDLPGGNVQQQQSPGQDGSDRKSFYDTNYEISV